MKKYLILSLIISNSLKLYAQNEIRLLPFTSYYLQNGYMNTGIYQSKQNATFDKLFGYGAKLEFKHYFAKHWSYQFGAGISSTKHRINIEFPLSDFSPSYTTGNYSYTYTTPSFSRLEINLGLGYKMNLSRNIQLEPYFNLLPIWELTTAKEIRQTNYYTGSNDIGFRINKFDGRIGNSRALASDALLDISPCTEFGINLKIGSQNEAYLTNIKMSNKLSYLIGLSYTSILPNSLYEGGINSFRITTYDEIGNVLDKTLWWDRINRFNFKIGVVYKLGR